ncbi:hypothetical protein KBY27_21945 [Ruegeria pomeroyi]|uniref:Uncharacterized protein n=2 Tax=Ruegeria pomeroyi TaxID=89184 RepID=A0A9Q3ZRZ8_9RHOB|nr:hypothetical protein [Ruegeria pomeroyi]
MAGLRMLSVAAASGRVGYVYLVGGRLKDWRMSGKAAESPSAAAEQTQKWINRLKPEVVVTEKPEEAAKKGEKTKEIIGAIARTAEHNYVLDVSVKREHDFANKYEEAEALVKRHPEIEAWLPKKRRFFDNEPRNTVLFEALSLAEAVMRGGSTTLGAAMG